MIKILVMEIFLSSKRLESSESSAGLSIGRLGRTPKGPDKLDLTRISGYKFRSSKWQGAYRSSAPRTQNELKSAQPESI
ncbi:hypothetical protein TNCV_2302321 [Trichonephila clavipes]|nr:hypothetical protein TNCV_2302321 [Trichonephila clavipes]